MGTHRALPGPGGRLGPGLVRGYPQRLGLSLGPGPLRLAGCCGLQLRR